MKVNALMPYSPDFKELGASGDPMGLLFMLVNSAWSCFTIYFIIRHTQYRGKILFFNLLFIMFFVQCFMTQIETLFFGSAFPVLTKLDILLIMIASLVPLLAVIPLIMKFFISKTENVVRYGHLIEMLISMLLFGINVGIIMWDKKTVINES